VIRRFAAPAAILLAAVVVLGPVLWQRGYVLVADMTFVPDQPWKSAWLGLDGSLPRAVPADAVVSVLGRALPGDLIQKAVLLGALVLAGLGTYRVAGRVAGISAPARCGGALLYLWNPYVFERLAIGHWGLLVGYAALPWVLAAALDVRRETGAAAPRAQAGLLLVLLLAAVGSPTGGLVAGLVAAVVVADRGRVRSTLVVLGSVLAVNLPWLAPGVLGDGTVSDGSGVAAFAARADTHLGTWGSLLTFGGIWKQSAAPDDRDALLLVSIALALVAGALVALVRVAWAGRAEPLAPRRLVVLAIVGLVLAGLPATGPGERLAADLVDAVPGAGLWRDSQKWLMPFVLVACLGFVLLLDGIGRRLRRHGLAPVMLGVGLLPVIVLPSLAWGLSGRYVAVDYPGEWSTVRAILDRQPADERRTAVLPWSAYQRLPWNDQRAALDPALRYFPGQVVVSEDLTLGDGRAVRGGDRATAAIGRAVAAHQPLGPALATAGVRYLLVERTAPSAMPVLLPEGTVLHEGKELLLLDLGGHARLSRASHEAVIVAADGLTGVVALGAMALLIRRKPDAVSGSMPSGSSINGGGAADYR
jgi:hypothetical protein